MLITSINTKWNLFLYLFELLNLKNKSEPRSYIHPKKINSIARSAGFERRRQASVRIDANAGAERWNKTGSNEGHQQLYLIQVWIYPQYVVQEVSGRASSRVTLRRLPKAFGETVH